MLPDALEFIDFFLSRIIFPACFNNNARSKNALMFDARAAALTFSQINRQLKIKIIDYFTKINELKLIIIKIIINKTIIHQLFKININCTLN